MNSSAVQQELRTRPLKQLYPEVDLRIKYRELKMQQPGVKPNFVFIRMEPLTKYNKMKQKLCVNIISPPNHQMGSLIRTLRDRLMKSGLNHQLIEDEQSLFLFRNNNLMTSFTQKIGAYWQANKEEDNILYLQYSDQHAPF